MFFLKFYGSIKSIQTSENNSACLENFIDQQCKSKSSFFTKVFFFFFWGKTKILLMNAYQIGL